MYSCTMNLPVHFEETFICCVFVSLLLVSLLYLQSNSQSGSEKILLIFMYGTVIYISD